MIGQSAPPEWLNTDWVLGQFSSKRHHAIARYIDFVRAGVGLPSLWEQLHRQIYLGSDQFVRRVQREVQSLETLEEVPRAQRRPVAKPLNHYAACHHDPQRAMAEAYLSGDDTMKTIADYFQVHYTTVSRAVKALEAEKRSDDQVAARSDHA